MRNRRHDLPVGLGASDRIVTGTRLTIFLAGYTNLKETFLHCDLRFRATLEVIKTNPLYKEGNWDLGVNQNGCRFSGILVWVGHRRI